MVRHPPDRRPLPFERWPAIDRAMWADLFRAGDVLDGGGAAAHWADGTRRKNELGYAHWLGFLDRAGLLDPDEPPTDRVTPERIAAYATALRARCKPVGVLGRIVELACVVKKMAPDRSWVWLDRRIARLRAVSTLHRDHVGLPAASELHALGRRLMDEAADRPKELDRALQHRDGLLIALLAARPIRVRNLQMIRIGRHLRRENGRWRLVFAADETKTRRPLDLELPDTLAPAIETWLERYRPVLLARHGRWRRGSDGAGDALWVSKDGTAMTRMGLSFRLRRLTQRHLDRAVGPHAFRAAAATEIAERDPAHVRIAAPLLGHTTFATADRHYVQARGRAAGIRYHDHIARLRRRLPPVEGTDR